MTDVGVLARLEMEMTDKLGNPGARHVFSEVVSRYGGSMIEAMHAAGFTSAVKVWDFYLACQKTIDEMAWRLGVEGAPDRSTPTTCIGIFQGFDDDTKAKAKIKTNLFGVEDTVTVSHKTPGFEHLFSKSKYDKVEVWVSVCRPVTAAKTSLEIVQILGY